MTIKIQPIWSIYHGVQHKRNGASKQTKTTKTRKDDEARLCNARADTAGDILGRHVDIIL